MKTEIPFQVREPLIKVEVKLEDEALRAIFLEILISASNIQRER